MEDTHKRFFFFSFNFWCENINGNINLSLKTKGNFPLKQNLIAAATEKVKKKYNEPEYKISVLIDSWVEMTEQDYYDFNGE